MADKPIEHGTLVAYKIDLCRCESCTAANRRYVTRRERLIIYGQWAPFVDAAPVRDHVRALSAAGIGNRRIAALAGISISTISTLLYGRPGRPPKQHLRPETAAAILAVRADLDSLAPRALIDSAGTVRRLQALACLGWSVGEQARRLGIRTTNYSTLQRRTRVTAATARAVRALYEQLSMTPAPDTMPGVVRARRAAARKGYLPPLAWDDDLIDLPDDQLQTELAARVAAMTDQELRRCHNGRFKLGDRSPLIRAGATEYTRRQKARALTPTPHRQEGSTAA